MELSDIRELLEKISEFSEYVHGMDKGVGSELAKIMDENGMLENLSLDEHGLKTIKNLLFWVCIRLEENQNFEKTF